MNTCACGNATDDKSTQCARCAAFQILEIEPNASEEEIKAAYLLLVKVWHPDRFQRDENLKKAAEGKLKTINFAYFLVTSTYPTKDQQSPPKDTSKSAEGNRSQETPEASEETTSSESVPSTEPTRWSRWGSFFALNLLLRCFILVCVLGVGGLLLVAADSFLSTDPSTTRFYSGYRAEVINELGTLKSNILERIAENLHKPHSRDAVSEPVITTQITPLTQEKTDKHPAVKIHPIPVRILPYITAGLTRDEVLTVDANPTSVSEDRLVYKGSEVYLKDDKVVGWRIDSASAPLRVKLWPDAPVDRGLTYFTVGSSKNEVLVVQGTPSAFSEDKFGYGGSEVYFKNNRVVSWKNDLASIPLRIEAR